MSKYLLNCFLLVLPLFIWNIALYKYLPKGYTSKDIWDDIPFWLNITENILRVIVFLFPLLMVLSFQSKTQKIGLVVYLAALLIYFLSWILQIYFSDSLWSRSLIGFMAPAYTTIFIFIGIAMIGTQSIILIPRVSLIYILASILFVSIHTYHSYLAYINLRQHI
ncbi:hypothetical protein ATO12_14875 [Aquimarina atlantica]|uniref:Uncharacterized protein n=1 Tax=Aquimarina atlantica TaxID=1317122 RepID=A0A023BWY1_9FLAO|nr:hypothetical protein [Aquimarina atlantica]EZH74153.1 hypothetical protein ATO12_14875 [Aquimarina atlantica]